jgi:hypothetical protein
MISGTRLVIANPAMTRLNGDQIGTSESAIEQTEAELERTRERFSASLGALREEISDLTEWRTWVERRPLQFLAGAFAAGLLVGLATTDSRR